MGARTKPPLGPRRPAGFLAKSFERGLINTDAPQQGRAAFRGAAQQAKERRRIQTVSNRIAPYQPQMLEARPVSIGAISTDQDIASVAGQLADLTHTVEQVVGQLTALEKRADSQQELAEVQAERGEIQQERIELAARELAAVSARLQAAADALRAAL